MAIALYLDHNVSRAILVGLQLREVDVISSYEDGTHSLEDTLLLDRAIELGRILFTHDDDLIVDAVKRQTKGNYFPGVIYAHQKHVHVGRCVEDLELIAKLGKPEEFSNTVTFLPL